MSGKVPRDHGTAVPVKPATQPRYVGRIRFTGRKVDVLRALVTYPGEEYRVLGKALNLTAAAVDRHVNEIGRQLGIHDRGQKKLITEWAQENVEDLWDLESERPSGWVSVSSSSYPWIESVRLPEFSGSITKHMAVLERVVTHLTLEQMRVLEHLRYHKEARIGGVAGSGKTLVAAEKSIRLAKAGLRTLFLCHNPLLAEEIRQMVSADGVIVRALSELDRRAARRDHERVAPHHRSGRRRDEEVSVPIVPLNDSSGFPMRCDAVVVDEGQDFNDDDWAIVDQVLVDARERFLYIFHDNRQILREFQRKYPVAGEPLDLGRNCRNAGPIHQLMMNFVDIQTPTDPSLKSIGSARIEVSDEDDMEDAFRDVMYWLGEAASGDRCVVLIPRGGRSSPSRLAPFDFTNNEVQLMSTRRPIPIFTVGEFKGLEKEIVIFVVEPGQRVSVADWYIAVSRARLAFVALVASEGALHALPASLRTAVQRGALSVRR